MCNLACGITTLVLGAILVFASSFVGYGLVDGFIENMIADEVALHEGTIQMERFETIPFPLTFKIRVFNITNSDEVLTGGVPVVNEIGPYIYKFHRTRSITDRTDDTLDYYITDQFEFDAEESYPHTEDDMLTIVNVPYHAILQVAEVEYEELMGPLSLGLSGVFGNLNTPIVTVRARDLFLDGLPICVSPGALGRLPCTAIRGLAASTQNIEQRPDGSLSFSLFGYRNGVPTPTYKVQRGINDPQDLASIFSYDNSLRLRKWPEGDEGSIAEDSPNQCNSINGTDTGIYPPFLDRNRPIFGFKSDICRSVELRFQFEHELFGVPVMQYSANEWYLDNHQGCFCLNLTRGVTGPDGCLLSGAMELYSCVGGFLVLSNPHFLYADPAYLNGVIGLAPDPEKHRVSMDLEPNTGIVLRGSARAQFNIFLRPITRISATANLPNTLTPIFWIDEGIVMPEEYQDELKNRLLSRLRLVDILIPVLVAVSCLVLILGIGLTVRARLNRPAKSLLNDNDTS